MESGDRPISFHAFSQPASFTSPPEEHGERSRVGCTSMTTAAADHDRDAGDDRFYQTNGQVLQRIESAYRDMIFHDGFGEMRVEVRILKRQQKEVIIHFGKQYRFVVDVE